MSMVWRLEQYRRPYLDISKITADRPNDKRVELRYEIFFAQEGVKQEATK